MKQHQEMKQFSPDKKQNQNKKLLTIKQTCQVLTRLSKPKAKQLEMQNQNSQVIQNNYIFKQVNVIRNEYSGEFVYQPENPQKKKRQVKEENKKNQSHAKYAKNQNKKKQSSSDQPNVSFIKLGGKAKANQDPKIEENNEFDKILEQQENNELTLDYNYE